MTLVLRQSFPLGRFHATPWRVNPFDDPFGEWPPSPWRFVRAVVARWYQWSREASAAADLTQLDELVCALCTSSYSFHVPADASRGNPLRQYHPVEFSWVPKDKFIPRMRAYGTSLAQDNYWSIPRHSAIWWFLDGERWTPELVQVLDRCLERLIYFGRAETFAAVERTQEYPPQRNCELSERPRSPISMRVLAPQSTATRTDVERITDDPQLVKTTVPPGAKVMYADLPMRLPAQELRIAFPLRRDCRLMQLAIGWNVPPEPRSVVRLTAHFRSAVLRELLSIKTQGRQNNWSTVPKAVRTAVADMFGKDADGEPLSDHSHAEFLAWWQDRLPTRLLIWRSGRPFDADEQAAIFKAASRPLSWSAVSRDADDWKIRLIPLDEAVAAPPGFDGQSARTWESVTPYVPPRHHLRGGKPRASESIAAQVRRECALRRMPAGEQVAVEEIADATWVAVHVPRRTAAERAFIGDRRGYWLRLTFTEPVAGPIRFGHSSSLGLGFFRPASEAKATSP
jgi:CRISPR-associated protein Csb2